MSHAQQPLASGRGARKTAFAVAMGVSRTVGGALGRSLVLAMSLAACHVVEAKVHNLDQLHDGDSNHRYVAAIEGDFEFVLRHKILGVFQGAGAHFADASAEKVEAPADLCLENLIGLEDGDPRDPVVAGRQVEWFARLAVEDPWQLSRERCVLALAAAGRRLSAGMPAGLGADQTPADAQALGDKLTPIVQAARELLERKRTRADLETACDGVRALELDLAGARRALRVVTELVDVVGGRDPDMEPLFALDLDLQRLCVRRALALAIDDRIPSVRAAALASTAEIGGRLSIDTVLFDRLRKDPEPEVAIAIVDALARAGDLPVESAVAGRGRDVWLETLYGMLDRRPESDVRMHAMMALGRLSGSGITSLREEDWQAWWNARSTTPSSATTPSPAVSPSPSTASVNTPSASPSSAPIH